MLLIEFEFSYDIGNWQKGTIVKLLENSQRMCKSTYSGKYTGNEFFSLTSPDVTCRNKPGQVDGCLA